MSGLLGEIIGEAAARSIPHAAIVELTRRCNLACRHCYAAPEAGRPELDHAELLGLLDQLRDLGTLFVTFSGGDPTVNRRFVEILRHASALRMCVQFFSNGLLIDEETADELARLNLFHVGISLYGATAETHDDITRRRGSFRKTVRAARLLSDRGVYVCFKFIAMNRNAAEAEAAAEMARELGIPIRVDVQITARDDLRRDTLALRTSWEQHRALVRRFQAEAARAREIDRNRGSDLWCVMGKTLVSINAYGDVFPCVTLPIPAGNVRYCSLREIWETSPFLGEVRRLPRLDRMHGCPECGIRPYCRRCPGNTFTETGDLYGPSPAACRQAVLWKEFDDERRGAVEETPIPPGLLGRHLPGWTAGEMVDFSGAGCTARAGLRSVADSLS